MGLPDSSDQASTLTEPEKTTFLVTGRPGVGKTTIVRNAARETGVLAGGFYTEEVRGAGVRRGFRIVTLDGESAVLADVDFEGMPRVSKYGVDVAALERVGVPAIRTALNDGKLVAVDEIGKMELLSTAFRKVVQEAILTGAPVLGTIMLAHHPWADQIKTLPQVRVVFLDERNRAQIANEIHRWFDRVKAGDEGVKGKR